MRTLSFTIEGQRAMKDPTCDFEHLVSGSRGYLKARFSFNKEWDGYAKVAIFKKLLSEYPAPIINGECMIPGDALDYEKFTVSVIGQKKSGQRLTTNEVEVLQQLGGGA